MSDACCERTFGLVAPDALELTALRLPMVAVMAASKSDRAKGETRACGSESVRKAQRNSSVRPNVPSVELSVAAAKATSDSRRSDPTFIVAQPMAYCG